MFAFKNGIPTPQPLDRVTWEDKLAIRYSFVPGRTVGQQMFRFWDIPRQMASMAELHHKIHHIDARPLGDEYHQKIRFEQLINSSERLVKVRDRALSELNQLPYGEALCHGDFAPGNIILNVTGQVVIDWTTGCVGDPAADVANTWLGMGELVSRSNMNRVIRWVSLHANNRYRHNYVSQAEEDLVSRVDRWLLPVAAARLAAQEAVGVREDYLDILQDFIITRWG